MPGGSYCQIRPLSPATREQGEAGENYQRKAGGFGDGDESDVVDVDRDRREDVLVDIELERRGDGQVVGVDGAEDLVERLAGAIGADRCVQINPLIEVCAGAQGRERDLVEELHLVSKSPRPARVQGVAKERYPDVGERVRIGGGEGHVEEDVVDAGWVVDGGRDNFSASAHEAADADIVFHGV